MPNLTLKRRLATGRGPNNIALNGVAWTTETPSVAADVFYKFDDEPDAEPQYIGKATAGHTLEVPIDLKGRPVRIFTRSVTAKGEQSVQRVEEAEQTLFTPTTIPVLVDATFNTPDIDLTIANNGGLGDISILRSIDGGVYGAIATVSAGTTAYADTPAINGTYRYKLTQAGQDGESNIKTVVITTVGAGAGSPPTGLTAVYDSMTGDVDIDWTNNGGTGSNVVERRMGSNAYIIVDTVASGATTITDNVQPAQSTRYYNYRVSNTSVAGYSNEAEIVVEGLG